MTTEHQIAESNREALAAWERRKIAQANVDVRAAELRAQAVKHATRQWWRRLVEVVK